MIWFDREFHFPLPSLLARKEILGIHLKSWNPSPAASLINFLSEKTVGYCGADLKVTRNMFDLNHWCYVTHYPLDWFRLCVPKQLCWRFADVTLKFITRMTNYCSICLRSMWKGETLCKRFKDWYPLHNEAVHQPVNLCQWRFYLFWRTVSSCSSSRRSVFSHTACPYWN